MEGEPASAVKNCVCLVMSTGDYNPRNTYLLAQALLLRLLALPVDHVDGALYVAVAACFRPYIAIMKSQLRVA